MKTSRSSTDFPSIEEMEHEALPWAAERPFHNTDEMKQMIAQRLALSAGLLAIRQKNGVLAFSNRVDWLTAKWTREGLHRGANKHYTLTEYGHERALKALPMLSDIATFRDIGHDIIETVREGMTSEQFRQHRVRASRLADQFCALREAQGKFLCEECGFDPQTCAQRTGLSPRTFLDVHHVNPLAEGERQSSVNDFQLLCPNCHRFVHALMSSKSGRKT